MQFQLTRAALQLLQQQARDLRRALPRSIRAAGLEKRELELARGLHGGSVWVADLAMDRKLLGIYLQDHHAGSTSGLELVRRARSSNQGTVYGDFLSRLADEIDADRRTLEEIMDDLGVGSDRAKDGAAWVGEKLGRLKTNGQLTGYSPLSRLVELEAWPWA